jgi:hypothetical protein
MPANERSTMADSQQTQRQAARRQGSAPHVPSAHDAHGQSVASWTAVGIIMLGALTGCVAVVLESRWLFVVAVVVVVVGAIAGRVLSAMGFGVSGRPGH